ncbi:MAG: 16S rRNA (cytosine(967)-C(5))-methyltransferase RsmB [Planctomycetes bacterium]|nr:16S rRNA (cytosine(967)-C(5))-methyltransferase RsmB [Planctomycetota bacterium]
MADMNLRGAAVEVLERAEQERLFIDDALAPVRERWPARRDRAFLTALVFGSVRHRLTLDALLEAASGKRHIDERVRSILRVAAYQLIYLTRVPSYAAVDEAVSLAKRRSPGAGRFVNAVLRGTLRLRHGPHLLPRPGLPPLGLRRALWGDDPVERLSIAYSHPPWLLRRWVSHGWRWDRIEALCAANNEAPVITVAPNVSIDPASYLAKEGIRTEARPTGLVALIAGGDLTRLEAFRRGLLRVQDEAAARAAPLLAPRSGAILADLCAAPGGKTAHLASLLGGSGLIVSIDRTPEKVRLIRASAAAFPGVVHPVVADARRVPLRGGMDGVLADVPCSNTGVLGRRADARWRLRPDDIPKLLPLQDALLHAAVLLVKPGGRLVYSTCSLEPEENEERCAAFLTRHPEFSAEEASRCDPAQGAGGGFAQSFRRVR